MDVTLTEEEFTTVYKALEKFNTSYTEEEVPAMLGQMRVSWRILQEVADQQLH